MSPERSVGKSVALVEWNWVGHHPMHFKAFVKTLLELGCNVVALCPKPEEVTVYLAAEGIDTRGRLEIYQFAWPHAPAGTPRRWGQRVAAMRALYRIRTRVRSWERSTGRTVDLLFFACMYDHEFRHFPTGRWFIPFDWGGLYLQCEVLRRGKTMGRTNREFLGVNRFFHSGNLHCLAVLDEGVVDELAPLAGCAVVLFPDFTDATTGDPAGGLASKLKRFAAGAPIVGLAGHLYPNKGVVTLAKLALDERYRDICFAFVGDLPWEAFSESERSLLAQLGERSPNSFLHLQRVSDNAFNSVLEACDIIFAGYIDFPHSSNMLTKAATVEKPVVVSDGYLMAERVRAYRLGEVVAEGDVDSTGEAIRRILTAGDQWSVLHQPRWDEYRQRHSTSALRSVFELLLGSDESDFAQ